MNGRKNIVFGAVNFAVKTLIEHVRLFVLILLTGIGINAVVVGVLGFLNKGFFKAAIASAPSLQVLSNDAEFFPMVKQWLAYLMKLIAADYFFVVLSAIILVLLFIGFYLGFNKVGLALYDRGKSSVSELFSCFKLAPRAFVALAVYSCILSIATLFFVIPGFIAFLRLSLFPYFIIDQNAGAIESLRMSYHATKNHVWDALALCVAVSIITGLGFMSWIGSIVSVPFSALIYVFFYRTLNAQNVNRARDIA